MKICEEDKDEEEEKDRHEEQSQGEEKDKQSREDQRIPMWLERDESTNVPSFHLSLLSVCVCARAHACS